MKTLIKNLAFITLVVFTLTFIGCEKEEEVTVPNTVEPVELMALWNFETETMIITYKDSYDVRHVKRKEPKNITGILDLRDTHNPIWIINNDTLLICDYTASLNYAGVIYLFTTRNGYSYHYLNDIEVDKFRYGFKLTDNNTKLRLTKYNYNWKENEHCEWTLTKSN